MQNLSHRPGGAAGGGGGMMAGGASYMPGPSMGVPEEAHLHHQNLAHQWRNHNYLHIARDTEFGMLPRQFDYNRLAFMRLVSAFVFGARVYLSIIYGLLSFIINI